MSTRLDPWRERTARIRKENLARGEAALDAIAAALAAAGVTAKVQPITHSRYGFTREVRGITGPGGFKSAHFELAIVPGRPAGCFSREPMAALELCPLRVVLGSGYGDRKNIPYSAAAKIVPHVLAWIEREKRKREQSIAATRRDAEEKRARKAFAHAAECVRNLGSELDVDLDVTVALAWDTEAPDGTFRATPHLDVSFSQLTEAEAIAAITAVHTTRKDGAK